MLSAYFLTFGIFESQTKKDGILKKKEQNVGIQSVERIRLFLLLTPLCLCSKAVQIHSVATESFASPLDPQPF